MVHEFDIRRRTILLKILLGDDREHDVPLQIDIVAHGDLDGRGALVRLIASAAGQSRDVDEPTRNRLMGRNTVENVSSEFPIEIRLQCLERPTNLTCYRAVLRSKLIVFEEDIGIGLLAEDTADRTAGVEGVDVKGVGYGTR